jgi:tetratricopeptide (TPR) repeat protein
VVDDLLDLARASGDRVSEGYALTRRAETRFEHGGDDDAMWADLEAAIAALEPAGETPELADALRVSGWARWRRGLAVEAEPFLRRAVEVSSNVGAKVIQAEATMDLAVTISMLGRGDEAMSTIEEAYALAKACGALHVRLRVNNNYPALLQIWRSDFRGAREILLEALELGRKSGALENIGWITGSLGETIMMIGDLREAEAYEREGVAHARAVDSEPLLAMRLGSLAQVLIIEGQFEEGEEVFAEATHIAQTNPEPQYEIWLAVCAAMLASMRGDHEGAERALAPAVAVARRYHVEVVGEAFVYTVRALVAMGRREEAAAYLDLSAPDAAPYARALGAVVEGLIADDPTERVRLIRSGVDGLEELGIRAELGRTLIDLARAEIDAGRDAGPTIERARDVLTSCGAFGWLPELDRVQA